jgi:nucleotide-binding universal stress UspA family protein
MAGLFERLLLATECGEFDTGAQALAFALARRRGLQLACVVPLLSNPEFESVAPELAAQAEGQAAAKVAAHDAAARSERVELDLILRRGSEPYLEIVDAAREHGADLIVIRRRGKRGLLANLLIGEMVSKVVAHAPCDVLIEPRGAVLWSRRVLVGIDPLDPDAHTLALAAQVAADSALPLRVLCVAASAADRPSAEQALSAAVAQARARIDRVDGEVRVGRAHQALIDGARDAGADLIVIARHGGEGLARAWIGGTAQKVIGLADCPVLVRATSS